MSSLESKTSGINFISWVPDWAPEAEEKRPLDDMEEDNENDDSWCGDLSFEDVIELSINKTCIRNENIIGDNFLCDICPKTFKNRNLLKRHSATHDTVHVRC